MLAPERALQLRPFVLTNRDEAKTTRLLADAIEVLIAPCDEPAKGENAIAAEGRSPAGAVPKRQAPEQTLPEFIREFKDDPTKAWIRIEVLKAALVESERRRVEAEADAAEARAQTEILARANADLAAGWVEDPTPSQETPNAQD